MPWKRQPWPPRLAFSGLPNSTNSPSVQARGISRTRWPLQSFSNLHPSTSAGC